MTKNDFISKYGAEKWQKAIEQSRENKKRKRQGLVDQKEDHLCITVDFNVPLPLKEEGMSNRSYQDFKLQRGQELAYHCQRMIGFKWARCHSKADQCIVIVEPIIYRNEYRMRCELYAKNVDLYKDWLIETIKSLDYE